MNNPIRALIQEKIEVKELRKRSNLAVNKIVLEIGCGNGTGTKLIQKYFSPKKIIATDLDSKMIKRAKKKIKDKSIKFEVANASNLKYKANTFDAIFDFGVIHHIPNWKDCLKELKRVLKPGGELILEDLTIDTFTTGIIGNISRKILDHPYKEMFTEKEFVAYLKKIGFKVKFHKSYYPLHILKYFVIIAKK